MRLGPEPLSFFWANPSRSLWMVGLGVCAEGDGEVQCDVEPPAGPWFGGWAFDGGRAWDGFDAERWVLPEVLAWWDGTLTTMLAFGLEGTPREALEARLARVEELEPVVSRTPMHRTSSGREAYQALVASAVESLRSMEKVVPARAIEVSGPVPVPERAVLKALEARNPASFTFLFRGRDGSAFVGATPELLCEVKGSNLTTEALAGTASPDQGERLLSSEKDRREHQAVIDDLRARLDPFVVKLDVPAGPELKRLASVVHLRTPIAATLRPGVEALEVARALHPTPAVAGTPRQAACEWLATNEGFSRGWYTGAIGTRGPTGLTLAVGLRCALVRERSATVYVGAGVVRGSTPEAEWLETERKAQTMFAALGVSDG